MSKTLTRGFLAAMTAAAMFAGAGLAHAADNNTGTGRAAASGPVRQATQALKGCFAVVSANGVRARSKCAKSSSRSAVGQYLIVFDADVRRCSFQATLGLAAFQGISPAGEIAVVGGFGTTNGVFVQTFNSAGAATDRAFHLTVIC